MAFLKKEKDSRQARRVSDYTRGVDADTQFLMYVVNGEMRNDTKQIRSRKVRSSCQPFCSIVRTNRYDKITICNLGRQNSRIFESFASSACRAAFLFFAFLLFMYSFVLFCMAFDLIFVFLFYHFMFVTSSHPHCRMDFCTVLLLFMRWASVRRCTSSTRTTSTSQSTFRCQPGHSVEILSLTIPM